MRGFRPQPRPPQPDRRTFDRFVEEVVEFEGLPREDAEEIVCVRLGIDEPPLPMPIIRTIAPPPRPPPPRPAPPAVVVCPTPPAPRPAPVPGPRPPVSSVAPTTLRLTLGNASAPVTVRR